MKANLANYDVSVDYNQLLLFTEYVRTRLTDMFSVRALSYQCLFVHWTCPTRLVSTDLFWVYAILICSLQYQWMQIAQFCGWLTPGAWFDYAPISRCNPHAVRWRVHTYCLRTYTKSSFICVTQGPLWAAMYANKYAHRIIQPIKGTPVHIPLYW